MKTQTRANGKNEKSKFNEYEPITGRYIQQEKPLLLLGPSMKTKR
ncbi:MAG: hypothetical protein QXI33_02725 [Candidatus Pacearchaeota archaeon]